MKKIIFFSLLALAFLVTSCTNQEITYYSAVSMDSTSRIQNLVDDINCKITVNGKKILIQEDTYVTDGVKVSENTYHCSNGLLYQMRRGEVYVYSQKKGHFIFKYFNP